MAKADTATATARRSRRVSEQLPEESLWPELARRDKSTLVTEGVEPGASVDKLDTYECLEVRERSKNTSQGLRTFYVCRCVDANGEEFTTILGGEVIKPKIDKLVEDGKLREPFSFSVVRPARYFDIV